MMLLREVKMHDDRVAALVAALEPLEWLNLADTRPELLPMCPSCHGTKNPHRFLSWTEKVPMHGHKPGCKIAIALERPMTNHAPVQSESNDPPTK